MLTTTGCQTPPGAAAFVGSTRISVDRVQQLVEQGLREPVVRTAVGGDVAAYRLRILGNLVRRELINGAAASSA